MLTGIRLVLLNTRESAVELRLPDFAQPDQPLQYNNVVRRMDQYGRQTGFR